MTASIRFPHTPSVVQLVWEEEWVNCFGCQLVRGRVEKQKKAAASITCMIIIVAATRNPSCPGTPGIQLHSYAAAPLIYLFSCLYISCSSNLSLWLILTSCLYHFCHSPLAALHSCRLIVHLIVYYS